MQIRPFRPGDEPALWAVFHSAVHTTAANDYTPEQRAAWSPPDPDPAAWARRMQGIAPFVAEEDGRIVGYADVQADGYIDHFFVAGGQARRGIGAALMRRIHDEASARGLAALRADVSITARPFFAHWGFRVVREQAVTVRGVTMTNFAMRKDLAPA